MFILTVLLQRLRATNTRIDFTLNPQNLTDDPVRFPAVESRVWDLMADSSSVIKYKEKKTQYLCHFCVIIIAVIVSNVIFLLHNIIVYYDIRHCGVYAEERVQRRDFHFFFLLLSMFFLICYLRKQTFLINWIIWALKYKLF